MLWYSETTRHIKTGNARLSLPDLCTEIFSRLCLYVYVTDLNLTLLIHEGICFVTVAQLQTNIHERNNKIK